MDALIVGTGLIGASVGAALRSSGWSVAGWDPSPAALAAAVEMGAVDIAVDSVGTREGVDLVVLAAPDGAIIATLA